jgi:hypothetical protein
MAGVVRKEESEKSPNPLSSSYLFSEQISLKVRTFSPKTQNPKILQNLNENLLLDLREKDKFEAFHIITAVSYPSSFFKRDKMIPDLVKFVNKLFFSAKRKVEKRPEQNNCMLWRK